MKYRRGNMRTWSVRIWYCWVNRKDYASITLVLDQVVGAIRL